MTQWEAWVHQFPSLITIKFQRCLRPVAVDPAVLHVFCDASGKAYGAAAYLATPGRRELVMARGRLAPTKPSTIPRLELRAAVIAVELAQTVQRALKGPLSSTVFWSDSATALAWITNDDLRLKPFVANRVQAIREKTGPEQWRYVPTKLNPADMVS